MQWCAVRRKNQSTVMALHGPASVLDKREVNRDSSSRVVRDRLTRHRSPAGSYNRYSYASDDGTDDEDFIKPKIPQPYRTSFSAVAPPERIKRDRSRSTSPCTSSLKGSNRSRSKSPGGRRSHKHVTYDEKVVIRDSDTSDSRVTDLSDKDLNDTSGHFSASSSMMESDMSNSSQRDYSSELRELSQQIVKEYSNVSGAENESPDMSSHIRNQNHTKLNTPNGTAKAAVDYGKQKQNVKVVSEGGEKKKIIVSEDYDNERSVSYRVAIKNHYSDEIKQQASEVMKGVSPPLEKEPVAEPTDETEDKCNRERHNSLPNENVEMESNRLTPAKRSISSSIGNFFRRLSPHVGRKSKKGNISAASSQSLSPGDENDGSFQRHNSTSSLSRGKLRKSLMKLMGKSKKDKSANKSDMSFEDLNQSNNSQGDGSKQTPKSALYMKSIEQTSKSDKDIYHKFKDRKKQKSGESSSSKKAVKASPKYSYPDSDKPSTTETSIGSSLSGEALDCETATEVHPPDTLDVKLIPKSVRALQASQISTISGDDSIGECSIDPNLTGSEPSLLSETSASKHVEVSRLSEENVNPVHSTPLASAGLTKEEKSPRAESGKVKSDHKTQKDLKLSYPQMPIIDDSADYFPTETPTRTPSYLRISSAVSGYGHYSRYSAYKGIEKRSPYSSTLSLRSSRSDLTTPLSPIDMPIGKIPNIQPPTNWPPLKNEILSPKSPTAKEDVESVTVKNGASETNSECINGVVGCDIAVNGENGHNYLDRNFVSTGDNIKDADYFLDLAQTEENRLLVLCSKCETELLSDSISEEGSGKIRSAVGKANLLISQKFRQFQDLCQQHKHPDPDSKPTKWEDLQGFWEMVKLQVDDIDEMFTEIDMMRQNGWREIKIPSRRSSSSSRSSPKSSSLNVSNASTPSHTPGSRRRAARVKDTPESSPERSQKAKMAAKVRDDARKKMLAEKRAAMKQRQQESDGVEIYIADNGNKSDSPGRTSGSDVADA